ncbi:P-loop containing nucleoside triphosphate hydrolase protein [Hyaloraphidium curvatum]|nr:P-loop containing nucleoside triphosphate hydrolase protein [Hyaloraphidium curvatum]
MDAPRKRKRPSGDAGAGAEAETAPRKAAKGSGSARHGLDGGKTAEKEKKKSKAKEPRPAAQGDTKPPAAAVPVAAESEDSGKTAEAVELLPAAKSRGASFADLGPELDARLLRALHKLRMDTPTPVQRMCVPQTFEGGHLVVRAPTGTGKTAAYLIPILERALRDSEKGSAIEGAAALILLPTRELAAQVRRVVKSMTKYLEGITCCDLTSPDFTSLPNPSPSVLISTPSRLNSLAKAGTITRAQLSRVRTLVVDEADLVLRFGHAEDLGDLVALLPPPGQGRVQRLLFSATMEDTPALLAKIGLAEGTYAVVDVPEVVPEEENKAERVKHHVVHLPVPTGKMKTTPLNRPTDSSSFLLLLLVLKLGLSPFAGRTVVYVASPMRAFKLRLFLEQFGIRGVVLDAAMPARTRVHKLEEFNRGVYDLCFATDGGDDGLDVDSKDRLELEEEEPKGAEDGESDPGEEAPKKPGVKGKDGPATHYSRGLDFLRVRTVVNLDLPPTLASYVHRAGRTGRGPVTNGEGHVLSFVPPGKEGADFTKQLEGKYALREFAIEKGSADAWKYRVEDALRSVTGERVKEARRAEVRRETVASDKLKTHFEAKPQDLHLLRHDKPLHGGRALPHLKHVPDYLLPAGARPVQNRKGRIWAPFHKEKKKEGGRVGKKKEKDPLKTFKAKA